MGDIWQLFEKIGRAGSPEPPGPVQLVVVGLGNPGPQYENSRHNAGFMAVDYLAGRLGVKVDRVKFRSLVGQGLLGGRQALLVKPSTFMNLSGEAVRDALAFYKLGPQDLVVIYDDVSLEPGRLRIRAKGSDGGHNGIKNILYHLGTDQFLRIRIGVGKKPHPDYDLADWVLGSFGPQDREKIQQALPRVADAAALLAQGQLQQAMNQFNG